MATEVDHYVPFPGFPEWDTSGFDSATIDQYESMLDEARKRATPKSLERALTVATRYAAVDTGALEGLYQTDRGFTKTIATQTAHWENALALKGEKTRRSIEDALEAYDYVLDAVTEHRPITQAWIRELHAVMCRHQETYTVHTAVGEQQQPLPLGEYKHYPNNPTNLSTGRIHHYAPPDMVESEMNRLIDQLRGDDFHKAHPVIQAAYAHYAYVCIHPFADGNGRVARALASVFLYRRPGVPLVIYADQRDDYIDALEAADDGVFTTFLTFIEERTIDTAGNIFVSLEDAIEHESTVKRSLFETTEDKRYLPSLSRLLTLCLHHFILASTHFDECHPRLILKSRFETLEDRSPYLNPRNYLETITPLSGFRAIIRSVNNPETPVSAIYIIYSSTGQLPLNFNIVEIREDHGNLSPVSPPIIIPRRNIFPEETKSNKALLSAWARREVKKLVARAGSFSS
ncbi:MAG: Fic family protein [Propionibacteriaceae bacterium]|jgi:Fic family protein|nr:Fic family protein [Propionibacteriaceae bacterium]